jgi:CHAD domain-containing protein/CYTH domain-containing protein
MSITSPSLDAPADEGLRRVLRTRFKAATKAAAALAENPGDAAARHDLRTALRRFRSLAKAFRPWLPRKFPRSLRRDLALAADATNAVRDADVRAETLRATAASLPDGLAAAARRIATRFAKEAAVAAAESAGGRRFGRDFAKLAAEVRARLGGDDRPKKRRGAAIPALRVAVGAAAREAAQAYSAAAARATDAADELAAHDARLAAKRLRYVLEPFVGERSAALPWRDHAAAVQAALGDHRDAGLLAAALDAEKARARTPAQKRAAGSLALVVRKAGAAAFARFVALRDAPPGSPDGLAAIFDPPPTPRIAGAPLEIERKFLLSGMPPTAAAAPADRIDQGWLPGEKLRERLRRTRRADGREVFTRTMKFGGGVVRTEIEEETTPELFARLWPATRGRRVRKNRHVVAAGGLAWEIDFFLDRDLVLAEVELPSVDTPAEPPDWLRPYVVREVTLETAYLNSRLAR